MKNIDDDKIMNWDECKRVFIKYVQVDKERIESIKKRALERLNLVKTYDSREFASFIVEDYYEVIKELLVAYLLKNGMRSKNHQCLISYFYKENPDYEREAFLIAQMSYFRNRLEYYGEKIPTSFLQDNKDDFEKIIELLLKMI